MTDIIQEPTAIVDTSSAAPISNTETTSTPEQKPIEAAVTADSVAEPVKTETEVKSEVKGPWYKETWKDEIAGEDKKLRSKIDRYKTPEDMAKALDAAQSLISSTRATPELPANASEDEVAKYRETYGVPATAKDYDLGVEIPEDYKAGIDQFLEISHQNNRSNTEVKKSISDYLKFEEIRSRQLVEQIQATKEESEKQLKDNWGALYETHKSTIEGFFTKTFGEEAEFVKNAYLSDGTRLGDNAKVLAQLLDISKNTTGAATIISNNIIQDHSSVSKRLKELDEMATNRGSAYWGANHEQFKAERDRLSNQIDDIQKNRR